MKDTTLVESHYTRGGLFAAIQAGIEELGKTLETVTIEDLGPVDEFHIGGRLATRDFLDQLTIGPGDHVLDVGCGIGGASRFAATAYGCRVSGIDLTREFIDTGTTLCRLFSLESTVRLCEGTALDLAFADASFDKAYMLHVGMNIADKAALAIEIGRVLKPGGLFGVYDIMRLRDDAIEFPVPWAGDADGSALAPPEHYREVLQAAGFEILGERNRRAFALEFLEGLRARAAASGGPPPLGLHLVMGPTAPIKIGNMVSGIRRGVIAPVEMVVRKT